MVGRCQCQTPPGSVTHGGVEVRILGDTPEDSCCTDGRCEDSRVMASTGLMLDWRPPWATRTPCALGVSHLDPAKEDGSPLSGRRRLGPWSALPASGWRGMRRGSQVQRAAGCAGNGGDPEPPATRSRRSSPRPATTETAGSPPSRSRMHPSSLPPLAKAELTEPGSTDQPFINACRYPWQAGCQGPPRPAARSGWRHPHATL